ncbi:MAG: HDOD domain-containing protein [Gammaproteobacteria bacterium]|nr:HDOD domain-containing protein [Gammaproteobacteria bacterium]
MEVIQRSVVSQIAKIRSLPPFPLLSNILKSFVEADETGDLRTLVSSIESEPSIVAKVIGTSNSAFYNRGVEIHSIRDAAARLGLNQLKTIVFSLVIAQKFDTKKCPNFDMGRYWYDTMLFAHCARHLAAKVNIPNWATDQSQVYCISLLLRIGLLALVHLYPQKMNALLNNDLDETLCSKEKHLFDNLDHFDVGSLLLQQWALPEEFARCIAFAKTADYSDENCELVWILQRSLSIVDEECQEATKELDDALGLTEENITAVLTACEHDKGWISDFASHLH